MRLLAAQITLVLHFLLLVAPSPFPARGPRLVEEWRVSFPSGVVGSERLGIVVNAEGALEGELGARHPPYIRLGPWVATAPFSHLAAEIDAEGRERVQVELRTASGARWSEWLPVASGAVLELARAATRAEVRLTWEGAAAVRSLVVRAYAVEGAAYAQEEGGPHPTVRLFATREGLVGLVTANGHVVRENDRFVALPSRRVLSARDSEDYVVEIRHRDRVARAPVWDVGPWNARDNFWDRQREIFPELPRFMPQAYAAFFQNHNDGRDQYGRFVTVPAAIDIADGTFRELGLQESSWVDVTLLWLNEESPEPLPAPAVVPKVPPTPEATVAPAPAASPTPRPQGTRRYFAEGSTRPPFVTTLVLHNVDPFPAPVRLTFRRDDGAEVLHELTLPPGGRQILPLAEIVPLSTFGIEVTSPRTVYVERITSFDRDDHTSIGVEAPATTWYLAEGSTVPPFQTWILLLNPNSVAAAGTITFLNDDGTTVQQPFTAAPRSRLGVFANQVVENRSFAVRVDSDQPIVVEESVYLEQGGGNNAPAAATPSREWYLAEGYTRRGFDTWLLLLNPNPQPALATVQYVLDNGELQTADYDLPPNRRQAIYVNDVVPDGMMGFIIRSDLPIVAERAMFFGPDHRGTHSTLASPSLARRWYFPAGSTRPPFHSGLMLVNPAAVPSRVTLSFERDGDGPLVRIVYVPPNTRLTLDLNDLVPDAAFSLALTSDEAIVAELTSYLDDFVGGTSTVGYAIP